MSSPSVASFFNVRKRAATDDILNARNKVSRLEGTNDASDRAKNLLERAILAKNKIVDAETNPVTPTTTTTAPSNSKIVEKTPASKLTNDQRRTTRRTVKRSTASTSTSDATKDGLKQPKIVRFTLGGTLSPRKKSIESPSKASNDVNKNATTEPVHTEQVADNLKQLTPKTTTTNSNKANIVNRNASNVRKELLFDDIKSKIGRSSRLDDLKAGVNKFQQLQEQYQACINKRNAKMKANSPVKLDGQGLKQFDTIELEVLSRFVIVFSFFFPSNYVYDKIK